MSSTTCGINSGTTLQPISPAVTNSPDAGGTTVRLTANYADQTSPEIPVDQHRPLDVGITAVSA